MDVSHGSPVLADSPSISTVCLFYILSKFLTKIDKRLILVFNNFFYLVMFYVTYILPFLSLSTQHSILTLTFITSVGSMETYL